MRFVMSVIMLGALTLAPALQAGQASLDHKLNGRKYIDALVASSSLRYNYYEDGASDGSVTLNPGGEVRDIVALGPKALPLLIGHLDDTRLTPVTFNGGAHRLTPMRVPVGHVCLDILMNIIEPTPRIFVEDCFDDGLGACAKDGYYFRPDAYIRKGNRYLARPLVRRVKSNWQRAFRKGYVRFKHPEWWGTRA